MQDAFANEVEKHVCGSISNGIIINIGAGFRYPAWTYFEKNWWCLLIEPDPVSALDVMQVVIDPRWKVMTSAISSSYGIMVMYTGLRCWSSLHKDWLDRARHIGKKPTEQSILVSAITPGELAKACPRYFDNPEKTLLFIDAEGSDEEILKSWPEDHKPQFIACELVFALPENLAYHYTHIATVDGNSLWKKKQFTKRLNIKEL